MVLEFQIWVIDNPAGLASLVPSKNLSINCNDGVTTISKYKVINLFNEVSIHIPYLGHIMQKIVSSVYIKRVVCMQNLYTV